jgi:hypothetical protein
VAAVGVPLEALLDEGHAATPPHRALDLFCIYEIPARGGWLTLVGSVRTAPASTMRLDLSGPHLDSLTGKCESFSRERSR